MRRIRLINGFIVLYLIVANLLVTGPDSVFACSCAEPGPPGDELAASTAVFAGKVIKITTPIWAIISSADPVKVTFQVSEVWKGPVKKTLVVTTAREDASCGYRFQTGGDYLVYARGTEGNLTTGLCSRTQTLSAVAEDLTALGAGTTPPAELSSPRFILLLLGGMGIVLVMVVLIVIRKRRGHPTP